MFEGFLSPLIIRQAGFRNRFFSTGHMTWMTANGLPTESIGSIKGGSLPITSPVPGEECAGTTDRAAQMRAT